MSAPVEPIPVRIRRLGHAGDLELPSYGSAGAAGLDMRAAVVTPLTIVPGETALIPTGFCIELPPGFEMQIRPRSGLAVKHGISVANSPATLDSDYRGEMIVALINHGDTPFVVERGMRVAQMVLGRVPQVEWVQADELSPTARGAGGFGHTGTR